MDYAKKNMLFRALMETFGEIDADVRREFEEMTWEDLERIEPIIDEMVRQAELRGRFEAYLEMAAQCAAQS